MHTVVIVEPHPLFRLGLRQLLSDALPQLSIEGHDYSSLEQSLPNSPGQCDLLLLSLASSRKPEHLAAAAVRSFAPRRMLLLSEVSNMPESSLNLPDCVAGFVPKEAPPEILQASVRLVLAGGSCFPAHTKQTASSDSHTATVSGAGLTTDPARYEPAKWSPPSSSTPSSSGSTSLPAKTPAQAMDDTEFGSPLKPGSAAYRESQLLGLTPRQYEVLVLLARGYPMKKVGSALNISVATAKAHTETLYQRLDVHNRNAAVYAAVSRGATLGWANIPATAQGQPRDYTG